MRKFALILLVAAGCNGGDINGGSTGDESDALSGSALVGHKGRVTATDGLHLRTGASTSYGVILTMPYNAIVTIEAAASGWYKVSYNGTVGWCSGAYIADAGGGSGGSSTPTAVADIVARAKSGVGFSYHWGGGCWSPGESHGACYGSCPSCSHSGTWGADCSGYVAKIWQVPGASSVSSCGHPYSTVNFDNEYTHWSDVSRSNVKVGDALVYNSNGEGHIFLYAGGDGWGWMNAYEAKGCSYGIVYDSRTAGSAYKAIRRAGL
jgi:uncharacterized protein YraI